MTACGRSLGSILPVLVLLAGVAVAQDPGKRWKSRNDRGNRYEGRIEIPVGRPTLDVLSLLAFREPYGEGEELNVRFYLPGPGELTLTARELEERIQYWMEAKPREWTAGAWNEWGPWPTRQILAREEVPAGNLGVLVRLTTEEGPLLLPAFVYHSAAPPAVDSYTLHLRPSADLSEVTYRLLDGEDELFQDRLVDLEAFAPFPIRLPTEGLPEGPLELEVAGELRGRPCGEGTAARCPGGRWAIYHRPPAAAAPGDDDAEDSR